MKQLKYTVQDALILPMLSMMENSGMEQDVKKMGTQQRESHRKDTRLYSQRRQKHAGYQGETILRNLRPSAGHQQIYEGNQYG